MSNRLRIPPAPTPVSLPNPPTALSLAQEVNDDNDLDLTFTQSQSPHYYHFELHSSTTETGTFTLYRSTSNFTTSPADFDNILLNRYYKAWGRNCQTSSRTGCGNWSAWSNTIQAQNVLNPPTNLTIRVHTTSDTTLEVNYSRSETPHKYQFQLYRSTSETTGYALNATTTVTTSAYNRAQFNGQTKGFWYKAQGRNCTTAAATTCGPWSNYSPAFHFTHPTLTPPTGISISVNPTNSKVINMAFTTTTTVTPYIYHDFELHRARIPGQFNKFASTNPLGAVSSPVTFTAPQGFWYRARAKVCSHTTGIHPCSSWSSWSNTLSPPATVFNFTPHPLTPGTSSNIWTVPSGTNNPYMEVYFSDFGQMSGAINIQRVKATGAIWSPPATYRVSTNDDSSMLYNVAAGWKLRVDVEDNAFSSNAALITLDIHSGEDASTPRIASAFVQLENKPSAPINGSATFDPTADTINLQWNAGTRATNSEPDHYEVTIPDPSNPDVPHYTEDNIDDSATTTTLAIPDALTRPGPGAHTVSIRHCSATGLCSSPLNINFQVSATSSPSVNFQNVATLRHIVNGRLINSSISISNTVSGRAYRVNLSVPSTTAGAGFTSSCTLKTKPITFSGTNATIFKPFTLNTCNTAPPFTLTAQLQERITSASAWSTLQTKAFQVEVLAGPAVSAEVDFGTVMDNMHIDRTINVAGNPKASRLLIKLDEMARRAHVITVNAVLADATVHKVNSIDIYTTGYSRPPSYNFLGHSQGVWVAPRVAVPDRQIVLEVINPKIGGGSNLVAYKVQVVSPHAALVERPTASLRLSTDAVSGPVISGNIHLPIRVQNNTSTSYPIPIYVDCIVSRGNTIITSGRKHGSFQVNPKPAQPILTVGSICQGILPQAGEEITLMATVLGEYPVSARTSNTLAWPGSIAQSLFHHSTSNLMGGLQVMTQDGICTMSFTIPLKKLSTNSLYDEASTTEHCAESKGENLNQGPLPSSPTSKVAEITITAPTTQCRMMQDADISVNQPIDCTIGDHSYGQLTTAVTPNHGHIFKPGTAHINNTTAKAWPKVQYFTGDRATDRFTIVAARPPVDGETVNKVGRTTGWTQGIITAPTMILRDQPKDKTCPGGYVGTENKRLRGELNFVECLSYAIFTALSGDSGSPVFVLDRLTTNGAILVGVSYGQYGTHGVFIPIDRIYAESLRNGYDWDSSLQQLRPIPAPTGLTHERIPAHGSEPPYIKVTATFKTTEFSPSMVYRADLIQTGTSTGIPFRSCFVSIPERTLLGYPGHDGLNRSNDCTPDTVPSSTLGSRSVTVSFNGIPQSTTGTFHVKLKACAQLAARTTRCGDHGLPGSQTLTLSTSSAATAAPEPPPAPSGFSAAASGQDTIQLTWTELDGADAYRIEQASETLDDWTTIAEHTTGADYTAGNLACNSTYAFRLTSHGDGETYQGWSEDAALTMAATSSCNNAPAFFAAAHAFPVTEAAPASTVVGIVPATDQDGDAVTYSILQNTDQELPFAIDETTSEITVQGALDYETEDQYSLTVEATDSIGATATTTVTITVTDAPEAPVFDHDSYEFPVAEDAATGHIVGTASANDQDAGDTLTYSIASGNETGNFTVTTSDSGARIAVAHPLDHDTTARYNLTIKVADAAGAADTATVVITVTEVEEEPPGDEDPPPERSRSASKNQITMPEIDLGATHAPYPRGRSARKEIQGHKFNHTHHLNELHPTGAGERPHPAEVPILTAP